MEEDEIDHILEEVEEREGRDRPEDDLPDARLSIADRLERCGPPRWVFRATGFMGIRFEGRPISSPPPPEKTIAFLYRRAGDVYTQAGVVFFANGHWRKKPNAAPVEGDFVWVAMVDERT